MSGKAILLAGTSHWPEPPRPMAGIVRIGPEPLPSEADYRCTGATFNKMRIGK